jgi:hypothetical protein
LVYSNCKMNILLLIFCRGKISKKKVCIVIKDTLTCGATYAYYFTLSNARQFYSSQRSSTVPRYMSMCLYCNFIILQRLFFSRPFYFPGGEHWCSMG